MSKEPQPQGRFDRATANLPEAHRERFYRANFEDLMGSAFPA